MVGLSHPGATVLIVEGRFWGPHRRTTHPVLRDWVAKKSRIIPTVNHKVRKIYLKSLMRILINDAGRRGLEFGDGGPVQGASIGLTLRGGGEPCSDSRAGRRS